MPKLTNTREPKELVASYLYAGCYFKQKGQRYWRLCMNVIKLDKATPPRPGKLLVIYDGCKQLTLDQKDIVIFK